MINYGINTALIVHCHYTVYSTPTLQLHGDTICVNNEYMCCAE